MIEVLGGWKDKTGGEGADEDEVGEVAWGLEGLGKFWTLLLSQMTTTKAF